MKKIIAVILTVLLVFSFTGCKNKEKPKVKRDAAVFKIGVILTGGVDDPECNAHITAIREAAKELSLKDNQVIYRFSVKGNETCYDTAKELASLGCGLIISNSSRHESYLLQAAEEFSDIEFVVFGGNKAKIADRSNFHNVSTSIYEARYITGVAAGLKLNDMENKGLIGLNNYDSDGNIMIGYVGTLPSDAATSSYTAFYLGVKSVCENVSMCVQFTNKRFDRQAEISTATQLIDQGCVAIAQHTGSNGVAMSVQQAINNNKACFCVGFDKDYSDICPDGYLIYAQNIWSEYYKELLPLVLGSESVEQDKLLGFSDGAVAVSKVNESCLADVQEEIDLVTDGIINGEVNVFDTDNFTKNNKRVNTSYVTDTDDDGVPDKDQAIFDGYFHESYFRSAPYFTLEIDGITVLN